MSENYTSALDWLASQKEEMIKLTSQWAGINTHTFNLAGLEQCIEQIQESFSVFDEKIELIPMDPYQSIDESGNPGLIPLAPLIKIQKRPKAAKQVLLVIHFDTVYVLDDPLVKVEMINKDQLKGPGVTDAKGGIAVMLKSLEAFEKTEAAKEVGWCVLLNSDEEIGSPSSLKILSKQAKKFDFGLLFEPSLPNGNLVGMRKGSGNFTLIAEGRSAHAGRDHSEGRNAIDAMAHCINRINELTGSRDGLTVNFGAVKGGNAFNVVPNLAISKLNIRIKNPEDEHYCTDEINKIINDVKQSTEVNVKMQGKFRALPKLLEGKSLELSKHIQSIAGELGTKLDFEESGGVSDGNRLYAAGLPCIDSMGVRGDHIHNENEFVSVDSFVERAQITALLLMKWASNEWSL